MRQLIRKLLYTEQDLGVHACIIFYYCRPRRDRIDDLNC